MMFYVKFDENGYVSEFVEEEKEGYIEVPNLNCRLVNGSIIDETEKVLNKDKIRGLDNWFRNNYRTYIEMFTRRKALGKTDVIEDEFRNRVGENAYHNLIELYEEAELVAEEIRNLRDK